LDRIAKALTEEETLELGTLRRLAEVPPAETATVGTQPDVA
jgi:hypothetical protein